MAGHSAFVSIFLLFVVIPLGISITILSKIGQAIGKGNVEECKRISKMGLCCSILVSGTISLVSLCKPLIINFLSVSRTNKLSLYFF